jgi:hypothetical protein
LVEVEEPQVRQIAKILWIAPGLIALGFIAVACSPTVRIVAPDKPIEINLNINMKIEQNVRVRVERELDRANQANPGIF